MTNSEKIKEMQDDFKQMELIIQEQNFKVKDAYRIMKKYGSVIRRLEQLEKSRDNWKIKHDELKEELGRKNEN